MKKLMILGGGGYAVPVIKTAHEMGLYVITADYLPYNVAHKYSDEYCNVSIIDKEATLLEARKRNIDGVMSFACDPGVITAAYVAEKMGLPSVGTYEAVSILQNKGKFRAFLAEHGFNVPTGKAYTSVDEALNDIDYFHWPVIVKPTDSAGSKGVTKVEDPADLRKSIENALKFSHCNEFIIEDFLQQVGYSSDTDSFSVNGELKFVSFNCQGFDQDAENPFTPSAFSWPSSMTAEHQKELTDEIQRLITLLGLGTSLYNIETRECIDGKAYIMECSPRGGGNRLAECLRYATGVDLIKAAVSAAIGEPVTDVVQKPYDGYWAEIILHTVKTGFFEGLWISDTLKDHIVDQILWFEPGIHLRGFYAANDAIGSLILRFDDYEELKSVLAEQQEHVRVLIRESNE
jgi:biotin carboxylase